MKASELIDKLKEMVEHTGDLDVLLVDTYAEKSYGDCCHMPFYCVTTADVGPRGKREKAAADSMFYLIINVKL